MLIRRNASLTLEVHLLNVDRLTRPLMVLLMHVVLRPALGQVVRMAVLLHELRRHTGSVRHRACTSWRRHHRHPTLHNVLPLRESIGSRAPRLRLIHHAVWRGSMRRSCASSSGCTGHHHVQRDTRGLTGWDSHLARLANLLWVVDALMVGPSAVL